MPKPDYELIRRLEAEVEQDPEQLARLRPVRYEPDGMETEQSSALTKRLAAAWGLTFVFWVIAMIVAKATSGAKHDAFQGWMPARLTAYVLSGLLVLPFALALVAGIMALAYYVIRGRPHPWLDSLD